MIMDDMNDPINLELSRVLPLYPAIGARKKPVLIENPAAALTLRTSHDPRDIVASCMSALVGVQPVGAFDESVTWTGGDASPYGHRKAAFLALGGFCCLAKPLTAMNCRYVMDLWSGYSRSVGIDCFSDPDCRVLNDTLLKFQDYVNKTPLFKRTWTAGYIQRFGVEGRKGCPDLEERIDSVFKVAGLMKSSSNASVLKETQPPFH